MKTSNRVLRRGSAATQQKDPLRCGDCGSSDMWRIDERTGIVAAIMRYRGLKPFQCRACRWICYRRVKQNSRTTAA